VTKAYKVLLTRQAENDLAEIFDYISADSPEAAASFIVTIEEKVVSLVSMPERVPMIPENNLLGTNYRHLIYGNYRIIFRIQEDSVLVLRIIHGARLLPL
jgi:toxin ParE1/3/4